MTLTDDQYLGLSKLEKWYRKGNHQFIDIAGVLGTGSFWLIQDFFERAGIETKEIMYLSYDQKQVLELAAKRYHTYYINGIIYKYNREVNIDSLPVVNPHSTGFEYKWKKEVRKKIDPRYRIIVVFDSSLMSEQTLKDLSTFGLPIILLRDPMLLPSSDTYTFLREPNIYLQDIHPDLYRNPIVYFSQKILNKDKIEYGNYDTVSIVHKKEMNLYNLKSTDQIITLTHDMRYYINDLYRHKIMKAKGSINTIGEKLIVMKDMYGHRLVNDNEKNIKVYLTRGIVGKLTKCNKHVETTKYVPISFQTDFYYDQFEDLVMDRHFLNRMSLPSRQIIPDEVTYFDYAYALTPSLARVNHWDKVTIIMDRDESVDDDLQMRLMYLALTRSKRSATIIS
jgi:hypothetical protein